MSKYYLKLNTLSGFTDQYNLLSDSSRGAGGNYTVTSAVNHTGVYVCRAEREKSVYKTQYSNTQLLWVTGEFKQNINYWFILNNESFQAQI